jgi:hypothetical protein
MTSTSDPFPSTPPELVATIENFACGVLKKHGLTAFEMTREAAIAHETGHAIVGTCEGLTIRRVTIFARAVPPFGRAWGGWCTEDSGPWASDSATSADSDLRRARWVIAGLAGEAITGHDRPGSSLDELALSQLVGVNAALKLDNNPIRSDEEYKAYAERLWHERVWGVAVKILQANREPFEQLAAQLHRKGKVDGGKLRKILAQVKRIAP